MPTKAELEIALASRDKSIDELQNKIVEADRVARHAQGDLERYKKNWKDSEEIFAKIRAVCESALHVTHGVGVQPRTVWDGSNEISVETHTPEVRLLRLIHGIAASVETPF